MSRAREQLEISEGLALGFILAGRADINVNRRDITRLEAALQDAWDLWPWRKHFTKASLDMFNPKQLAPKQVLTYAKQTSNTTFFYWTRDGLIGWREPDFDHFTDDGIAAGIKPEIPAAAWKQLAENTLAEAVAIGPRSIY
jgi:hypothetical protein